MSRAEQSGWVYKGFLTSTSGNIRVVADDFALKDHPGVRELGAPAHPLEDQAEAGKLFYHKGDGNIACYGYGAGIAMSTMDALCAAGGRVGHCYELSRVEGISLHLPSRPISLTVVVAPLKPTSVLPWNSFSPTPAPTSSLSTRLAA